MLRDGKAIAMVKRGIPLLIALYLMGCASIAERQSYLVTQYVLENTGIDQAIRVGIESGKVVPGMTPEQVYIASGEKAKGFQTYSIWVANADGTLSLPPTVIGPGIPIAMLMRNNTQFTTSTALPFVVYFSGDKRVLRVERGSANIKDDNVDTVR